VGVGAGQQSRVDCVKLAGRKVATWFLRQHPKVQALPFKPSVRKQDRINARVGFFCFLWTVASCGLFLNCSICLSNTLIVLTLSTLR
jgi:AICAR transformylase/IMP cyclohydrolase PurH